MAVVSPAEAEIRRLVSYSLLLHLIMALHDVIRERIRAHPSLHGSLLAAQCLIDCHDVVSQPQMNCGAPLKMSRARDPRVRWC